MRKIKIIAYSFLPALALAGALGVGVASAHGPFGGGSFGFGFGGFSALTPDQIAQRTQDMFQREAQILGISADDVKAAWTEGKSFKQIIEEKGLNKDQVQTRIKEEKTKQAESQLQTLVDKGVITREQADRRLVVMQERFANGSGHKMGKGMHRGFLGW